MKTGERVFQKLVKPIREILRCFVMDLTATDCSELSTNSAGSLNAVYLRMRRRLANHCEQVTSLGGELKAGLSYFSHFSYFSYSCP